MDDPADRLPFALPRLAPLLLSRVPADVVTRRCSVGSGTIRAVARECVHQPLRIRRQLTARGRFDFGAGFVACDRARRARQTDRGIVILTQRSQNRTDGARRQLRDHGNRRKANRLRFVRGDRHGRQPVEDVAAALAVEQAARHSNCSHADVGFECLECAERRLHEARVLTAFEHAQQATRSV